jgi:hypothetical protein
LSRHNPQWLQASVLPAWQYSHNLLKALLAHALRVPGARAAYPGPSSNSQEDPSGGTGEARTESESTPKAEEANSEATEAAALQRVLEPALHHNSDSGSEGDGDGDGDSEGSGGDECSGSEANTSEGQQEF